MTTRREVLKLATGAAAGFAMPAALTAKSTSGTLLILGGTGFLGSHVTEEALHRGWQVTHFNRGKHATGGVAGIETLIGDRKGQMDALRGRKWNVVIDDTGFFPKYVKMSAELLAPNVDYCLYISSIAAYASLASRNDESSPTAKLPSPDVEDSIEYGPLYGPMKALCEQYSEQAFRGRIAVVRPGFIVGPLDPNDILTYWPVRASKGGEMLAPGRSHDPIQVIDVRDLAAWMMRLVESRTTGYFNADSPPGALKMGDLIKASQQASPKSGTTVTWVSEDFLAAHKHPGPMIPWWPMKGDAAGASLTSVKLASQTGLHLRPLQDTVRDTLTWFQSLPAERQAKLQGIGHLGPHEEADMLRAWHESNGRA